MSLPRTSYAHKTDSMHAFTHKSHELYILMAPKVSIRAHTMIFHNSIRFYHNHIKHFTMGCTLNKQLMPEFFLCPATNFDPLTIKCIYQSCTKRQIWSIYRCFLFTGGNNFHRTQVSLGSSPCMGPGLCL